MDTSDHPDNGMTLEECVGQVRAFHERIRAPIATSPHTLRCDSASALAFSERLALLAKDMADAGAIAKDVLLSRAAMAIEELGEWIAANAHGDLTASADALGDRLFLLLGDAVASGLPLVEVFRAIASSNATKMPLVTTGVGKAVKGRDYQPPDLEAFLKQPVKDPSDSLDRP